MFFNGKKERSIQNIFFRNILFFFICTFMIIFCVLISTMIHDSVNMFKKSRFDVLAQIKERNQSLYHAMRYLADDLYADCSDLLVNTDPEQYDSFRPHVEEIIEAKSSLLNNLDMFPNVMILMKTQDSFCSPGINDEDIKSILSTYWYIDNLTDPRSSFFTSRYYVDDTFNNIELCYVRSLIDTDGSYLGCIIVGFSSDYLKNAFKDMIDQNYIFYVLDKSGTAISHSIPSMLGSNLYYMPYFWSTIEPNSSSFIRKNTGLVLRTNSYDPETGWTIVEEVDYRFIFKSFSSVFFISIILAIICLVFSVGLAFLLAKKISRPIRNISEQMRKTPFQTLKCQTSYQELNVLSTIYNLTVKRMNQLIEQIKTDEKEKRKLELSFLQAQINPHFLHNTLFTIKCLIEMKNFQKADAMISSLLRLLKIPFNAKTEWICIKDEISYLQSYLSLMQYRYDKKNLTMEVHLEDDLKEVLIPRLILQPIIENSLFHGFDDSCKNGVINLSFRKIKEKIFICIRDNGKGMTQEALDSLWDSNKKTSDSFNKVSLVNIKQRIQLLYGDGYGISVVSVPNEGTETLLTLAYKKEGDI